MQIISLNENERKRISIYVYNNSNRTIFGAIEDQQNSITVALSFLSSLMTLMHICKFSGTPNAVTYVLL